MRTFAAGWMMQRRSMRKNPDWSLDLYVAPLQTAVFVTVFLAAGRADLTAYGVLAPALISLFHMSLGVSGEIISRERENGSLEGLLAAPGRFDLLLLGRMSLVSAVSLLTLGEAWAVGWLLTGEPLHLAHPAWFAATVAVTVVAMTGWAGVMAAVFVLARSVRTFQNALSYPFFVLGGVLVPVALLPEPVQPVARLVFLSWSSDLLRDTLEPGAVPAPLARLAVVALLGAAGFVVSNRLLRRTVRRVRTTGSLSHG